MYGATTYHLYVTNLSLKAQYSASMLDASFLCSFFSYLSLHATLSLLCAQISQTSEIKEPIFPVTFFPGVRSLPLPTVYSMAPQSPAWAFSWATQYIFPS